MPDEQEPNSSEGVFNCFQMLIFFSYLVIAVFYFSMARYAMGGMWVGIAGVWLTLWHVLDIWRSKK